MKYRGYQQVKETNKRLTPESLEYTINAIKRAVRNKHDLNEVSRLINVNVSTCKRIQRSIDFCGKKATTLDVINHYNEHKAIPNYKHEELQGVYKLTNRTKESRKGLSMNNLLELVYISEQAIINKDSLSKVSRELGLRGDTLINLRKLAAYYKLTSPSLIAQKYKSHTYAQMKVIGQTTPVRLAYKPLGIVPTTTPQLSPSKQVTVEKFKQRTAQAKPVNHTAFSSDLEQQADAIADQIVSNLIKQKVLERLAKLQENVG